MLAFKSRCHHSQLCDSDTVPSCVSVSSLVKERSLKGCGRESVRVSRASCPGLLGQPQEVCESTETESKTAHASCIHCPKDRVLGFCLGLRLGSGESPLPSSQRAPLAVSSLGSRGERAPWGLFHKGTNPVNGGSTLMT